MTGLLERSLSAAVVIIILILFRKLLLHKLPKFAFRAAWAVVILRLLIPFSVPVFSADMQGGISQGLNVLMRSFQEAGGGNKEREDADGMHGGENFGGISGLILACGWNGSSQPDSKDGAEDNSVSPGSKDSLGGDGIQPQIKDDLNNDSMQPGSKDGLNGSSVQSGSKDSLGADSVLSGSKDSPSDGSTQSETKADPKTDLNSVNTQPGVMNGLDNNDMQLDSKDSLGTGSISPGSKDSLGADGVSPDSKNDFVDDSIQQNSKNHRGSDNSQLPILNGNAHSNPKQHSEEKAIITFILKCIWLFGVFSLLLYFLCSHLRARKLYAAALPVEYPLPEVNFHPIWSHYFPGKKRPRRKVAIKVSDQIFAPVTYGVLSPVILLPKTTDWENTAQLRMVLEHEAVHIRRFDILYKWLLAAAVALHWFNPFVWAMYFFANRDIELSCDEAVVRSLKKDGKKDYALALLNYEEKRMFSPTVSGFGGNAVRERIEAIMKINKTSIVSMAMAVILVAGTTTVFAGAKENKNTPENGQEKIMDGNQSAAGVNSDGKEEDGKIPRISLTKSNVAVNPNGQEQSGQTPQEGNQKNENADGQEIDKKSPSANGEDGSADGKTPVKQYLCEPAYYTPEEYEEIRELDREDIRAMLKDGMITQEDADDMLAEIEKDIEEVRNGRKCEKPSQVFYADGTPLVNSQGYNLYVKASDIERMNAELRAKAEAADAGESAEADSKTTMEDIQVISGNHLEDLLEGFASPETALMDLAWYTAEEYREYVKRQKEEYRSMKGEWGFNSWDGWYEWDDEKIEEACRLLDENLEFIENGGMISMPMEEGGFLTGLILSSSSFDLDSTEEDRWVMSTDELEAGGYIVNQAEKFTTEGGKFDRELLKDYEAFGVTADEKAGSYLYQGRKIAGLRDSGFLWMDGSAEEGNGVYLKGVREEGKLVGLEEISKEEFQELAMRGTK